MRRLLLAACLVAFLSALASGAASAAVSQPTITPSESEDWPTRSYILSLPEKRRLTAGQLDVEENGQPVDSLRLTTPGAVGSGAAVLLIDASNSMKGEPIAQAIRAARGFVDRSAGATPLGIVLFNNGTKVLVQPTTDRAAIDNALSKVPALAEGTHIYDGLEAARTSLQSASPRGGSIVLLSDGADVGSTVTQEQALENLSDQAVRVFSVGLRSSAYDPEALRTIAKDTRGEYAEASTASQLTGLFEALGFRLANEYLILYRSLLGPVQPAKVTVHVDGYPGAATDAYTTPKLFETSGVAVEQEFADRAVQSPLTMIIIVLVIVGILLLGLRVIWTRAERARYRKRLGQYVSLPAEEEAKERRAEITAIVAQHANKPFGRTGLLRGFAEDCEIADVKWAPATLLFLAFGGAILVAIVAVALFGNVLALFLGILVPIGVRMYVTRKLNRKRKAFAEQLPDNLDVLASALRAGHSLIAALSVVAEDAPEPSKSELRRVIADEQLGAPLEDAFEVCVRRMANRDLEQVAIVALLQREAGGNAAEVIDQVSANVRARMDLRRLVNTLTAQGRLARWIVSLLPVALFFAIFLINRDYLRPLWTTGFGIAAMVVATIMVISGSLVIKKIVNIKI